MAIQNVPELPQDTLNYAATEAGAAHQDTQKILDLLAPSQGQVDPLAAIIDALEIMNGKLDRILQRLPPSIRPPS